MESEMGPSRETTAAPGLTRRACLAGFAAAPLAAAAPAWRMRLSASSIMFWQQNVIQACQTIAKLGCEGVDIWSAFHHCTHLEESRVRFTVKGGLKALLAQSKLQLSAATVYWTGVGPFADYLGEAGGAVVVRGSGNDTEGGATAKMRAFLETLKPDLELAEKHNLRIAVENHSGPQLLNRLDTIKAFVDLNRSPRLGIALAAFHVQKSGESVEEAIRVCGQQLLFFYAWQLGELTGYAQLPGHGGVDCAPWIAALKGIGYEGFVNVFMHGDRDPKEMQAAVAKSLAYLRECEGKSRALR